MTLTEFLLARIAEDEATSRALAEAMKDDSWNMAWAIDEPIDEEVAFAARFIPARVLAECEAKRRIVELWTRSRRERRATARPGVYDWVEVRDVDYERDGDVLLELLALPYSDHPDYRQEWKP